MNLSDKIIDSQGITATGTSGAYYQMFYNCTSLSSITVEFEEWDNVNTLNWVVNVPSGGKFYCPSVLSAEYGVNRIPVGWSKIDL